MHQTDNNEIWQVEVAGQTYEAPLGELPDWISEGSLQPEDKVRKGNLRWIEARKVPALVPFFNARANGTPIPVVSTVSPAIEKDALDSANTIETTAPQTQALPGSTVQAAVSGNNSEVVTASVITAEPGWCLFHQTLPSVYICTKCKGEYCKACPSSYGGEVRICPECGSLCTTTKKAAEASKKSAVESSIGNESFGFNDLSRAFAHPFKFKPSLVFGGLMFMFFTLGQLASGIGGIVFIVGALVCGMLANMLTFGILANTVENFSQGRLDADFMPGFDDFSLWDDVIHPFFLSIGVYISSFGPFILVAIIGMYLVISAAGEQMKKYKEELTRVPGTQFYSPDRTAEQSKQVKELLERVKQQNERRLARQQEAVQTAESGDSLGKGRVVGPDELDRDLAQLQEAKPGQVETAGAGPAGADPGFRDVLGSILKLAAPLAVFGGLALLWGLFYFPAACAVAGYSRSFLSTINPLVGLDTIRRLGVTYAMVLLMCLLLLIAAGVVGFAVQIVLMPFTLPGVGNLPATAVGSFVTFFFWTVFSCMLGYAMFKSADRLKLYR